jgi:hypothetical protein
LSEKQRFWRFISQNVRETARFLPFSSISGGFEGLLASVIPSTTTPGPGTPLPIVGPPSSSGAAHAVSSSF